VTWLGCGLCNRSNITWAMHICNIFWLNKNSFHLQSGKRWVGVGFGLIGHDEDVKVQPERFLWCLQDLSPILKLPKLVKTKSSTNKLEQKKTNPPPQVPTRDLKEENNKLSSGMTERPHLHSDTTEWRLSSWTRYSDFGVFFLKAKFFFD
jgi:hypothetical protein